MESARVQFQVAMGLLVELLGYDGRDAGDAEPPLRSIAREGAPTIVNVGLEMTIVLVLLLLLLL